MKYLKLFESFDKNSKKLDFSELDVIDVENCLIPLYDEGRLKFDISYNNGLFQWNRPKNLFNDKCAFKSNFDNICVKVSIYRRGIQNFNFDAIGYGNSVVENYLRKIYNRYNVNIFTIVNELWSGEFICELTIILVENKDNIKESINEKNHSKIDFEELDIIDVENCLTPLVDNERIVFNDESVGSKPYYVRMSNLFNDDTDNFTLPFLAIEVLMLKRGNNYTIDVDRYTKSILKSKLQRIYDNYNVNIFLHIMSFSFSDKYDSKVIIYVQPKKSIIKETVNNIGSTLIIVDVQQSFNKFFSEKYLSELNKYCRQFGKVYQIFDNHVHGKNPDKDYLYDSDPDIENKSGLYKFNNQVDLIEKRYTYDVNVDFFKKILDNKTYNIIKKKESENTLVKGEMFNTTEGTVIVYIGNNHVWYHCPKKLYDLFGELKGKQIIIVGGSDDECLHDVVICGKALGVNLIENHDYIYSATHCPF